MNTEQLVLILIGLIIGVAVAPTAVSVTLLLWDKWNEHNDLRNSKRRYEKLGRHR